MYRKPPHKSSSQAFRKGLSSRDGRHQRGFIAILKPVVLFQEPDLFIIDAYTSVAADLNWPDQCVGMVEAGKYADLIVVTADPLQGVRAPLGRCGLCDEGRRGL